MTSRHRIARGPRLLAAALCVLAAAVSGIVAAEARGAFGDDYGIAPVNVPGADPAPIFPGQSAFWAGTCDLASAPIGPIEGGIGTRTNEVWAPPEANSAGSGSPKPAPDSPDQCFDWGRLAPPGSAGASLWNTPPSWRLAPVTQAGAHPDGSATFWFRRDEAGFVDGTTDNVYIELPAGFSGDPRAVPKCTAEQFAVRPLQCPPKTQVGVLHLYLTAAATSGYNYLASVEEILPVYNLEPRKGRLAEFGIAYVSGEDATTSRIVARSRTSGDFGITGMVTQLPAALPVISSAITLWGVPWSASHDMWRPRQAWRNPDLTIAVGEIPPTGLPENTGQDQDDNPRASYDRSWGPIKPFLSNPTECSGAELSTRLVTDAYERQGALTADGEPDLTDPDWAGPYFSPAPPVTGCEKVPFDADIDLSPTTGAADAPSGLSVDLRIPQNDEPPFTGPAPAVPGESPHLIAPDEAEYVAAAEAHWKSPAGLATSHLDRAVVTLPEGFTVNPSGAAGLEGCSDAQMGVTNANSRPMTFNNDDPFDGKGAECPPGSKIGTVTIDTVLDEPLTGDVVLGTPRSTDPESGDMFRLFIVARAPDRGLVAKIAGSSIADRRTGQLTATFDKNPRLPFERMRLELKGGPRGLLATPQRCGAAAWLSSFSPWSAAHGAGGTPVSDNGAFDTNQSCAFGFSPTLDAGMDDRRGGKSGKFTFRLSRNDGDQWLGGLSAKLPTGLLAAARNVPLCTNRQATQNACPLASKIGSVDAGAGAGAPFFLEKPGSVYLTEGYKGGAYGLSVSVPVEAGPFRGPLALDPIVVRQALRVDPDTAQVTAVSDPLPQIWHGIPLRVRQVTVTIDRPGFMRNPTNCSAKRIVAEVTSATGAAASPSDLFQATECRKLRFKPKLAIRLTGKRQTRTGGHPGVRALLTQPRGQANLRRTTTKLPLSLALDPKRAQSDDLCEFEPSKVANCPRSSIIGRARAVSPLLKRPLSGPVYFAKNVRINERGNAIRTLPSLVIALRGEVALNVRANSDSKRGKLITTFPSIPDAAVSRFELNLSGGRKGILQVTKTRTGGNVNICSKPQVTDVELDAHNGRQRDFELRMKTPCTKAKRRS
ncbi:MAG TPA: hypothetical protein VEX36_07895 [Thermoleophilaceae bacterium]|nr:hypothetical protein [Thermoleophilaceae bacterium]